MKNVLYYEKVPTDIVLLSTPFAQYKINVVHINCKKSIFSVQSADLKEKKGVKGIYMW